MIAKFTQPLFIAAAFIAGLAVMFVGYFIYDAVWAYPGVRIEARNGYVAQTILVGAQAERDFIQKQLTVGQLAQSQFERVLKTSQELADAKLAASEQEIAQNEKELRKRKRECIADDLDVEFMLKP